MANTEYLIDRTDLKYYHDQYASRAFAGKDLETTVQGIVAEGGEPNVIETVKVNGTALTVADKAVDVSVPTTVAELADASNYALAENIPTDLSELDNTGSDPYATQSYVEQNGGKIDSIKVNGTEQTISAKAVDIVVPTSTSELTNDSGYQTADDVNSAISSAVSSVYRYKGSVATKTALPTDAAEGDVYDVQSTGMNYAWNGSKWDELGSEFDGSLFWDKETYTIATTEDIDEIFNG